MLDKLQYIGYTVRTVKIDIALLLTDECLITLWLEQLPRADEVLHNVNVRTRLNVEVAGIEESTDVQAGNKFQRLILRIGLCSLAVQVEVVAFWCLKVTLLKRLAVPRAVAFIHVHVVHVDGHPDIGRGIGYLVIDMLVDEEVIGTRLTILYIINTRFANGREVELHIVVLEVGTPCLDVGSVCDGGRSV